MCVGQLSESVCVCVTGSSLRVCLYVMSSYIADNICATLLNI